MQIQNQTRYFPIPHFFFFFSARKNLVQPWSAGEQAILNKSISTLKIKNGCLDHPLPTPKHCLLLFLQQCHKFLSRGGSGITLYRSTEFITGHYFVKYAKDVGWDCKIYNVNVWKDLKTICNTAGKVCCVKPLKIYWKLRQKVPPKNPNSVNRQPPSSIFAWYLTLCHSSPAVKPQKA